jgi:thiol-disulfide isomerase/thioredoxin
MKNPSLIQILIASLFLSCSRGVIKPEINISGSSYLKIEVSNIHDSIFITTRTVTMFPFCERTRKNVLITNNGTLFMKYDISIPELFEFEINMKSTFETYLIPNDTLTISLEQNSIDSIHYSTSYSCENFIYEYLQEKHKKLGYYILDEFPDADKYWYNAMVSKKTYNKGLKVADSLQNSSLSFLEKYPKKLPDWFNKFEASNIQYSAAYSKIMLHGTLTKFTQKEDLPISNKFYNTDAKLSNHYYSFIQLYLTYSYPPENDPIDRLIRIYKNEQETINSLLKSDIRNYFVTCFIGNLYSYCGSMDEINRVDAFYKATDFKLPSEEIKYIDQKRLEFRKRQIPKISLNLGDSAPDFQIKDSNGVLYKLSDYKGRIVYLHFWATWCGACIEELPLLNEFANKIDPNKIVIVNVCLDDAIYKVKKFINAGKLPGLNLICDQNSSRELAEQYVINYIPYYSLIDENGLIIKNNCDRPAKIYEYIEKSLNKK